MLLSDKHGFLFIHNYKTAGQSITKALLPYAMSPLMRLPNAALQKLGYYSFRGKLFTHHATAWEVRNVLGEQQFDSYLSFVVVRNPWDWQVSLYSYILKNNRHHSHGLVKSLGSFENYIDWQCTKSDRKVLQTEFMNSPSGEQLVDYIIRFENLSEDFDKVCLKIGISASLPRLNVSNTNPYVGFYSENTRSLVADSYAKDIEMLGYAFPEAT